MILIGLGANLPSYYGSPEETLKVTQQILERAGIHIARASQIWTSAPVPLSDQPWYRNAVIQVETEMSAEKLFQSLQNVEQALGRERWERNAARVIDLDLLAYNNQMIAQSHLHVPHPRLHERAFVLYPLWEIAPLWKHPALGKTVSEMIANLPQGQELKPLDTRAA